MPNLALPISLKSDPLSTLGTVGVLPYWEICIEGSQSVRQLLNLLDNQPQICGVMVFENNHLVGLIPRELVYEKIGRPFGVELFLKLNTNQFYELLGISTLVIAFDTLVEEAVKLALMRDEKTLYEPIVVEHPSGHRVITMYSLLKAQQETLRGLYSEVHQLSIKDPLTQVNNRRGFFDNVNKELVFIRQFDLEYAVLMIDIDHFKIINDRYGHPVGDEVLKSVSQQILGLLQEKDVFGRFGGEEFFVFLVDCSPEATYMLAEKLRQKIASYFHIVNGYQIRVTISIGVSVSKGAQGTLDMVFSQADQAMYAAKNLGRNKVIQWRENLNQSSKKTKIFRNTRNEPENQPEQLLNQTLDGLLRMLYLRDFETEAHTLRVSALTLNLAKTFGVSEAQSEGIRIGSLLHDIGKIAIPDNILFKPGKLNKEEWAIMQKHTQYAHDLLAPISYFQSALDIPYCHHEHWNGEGYPRGLRKLEIPLAARIFTIVDVWDALCADRPYRAAWKESDVKQYLVEQSGILFDPELVPAFLESLTSDYFFAE